MKVKKIVYDFNFFQLILALGSVLNEGTYLSSNGFKIDSLLKLAETKARNNRTTLLHYLTQLIQNKIPELLNFRQDFPHVEAASKSKFLFPRIFCNG